MLEGGFDSDEWDVRRHLQNSVKLMAEQAPFSVCRQTEPSTHITTMRSKTAAVAAATLRRFARDPTETLLVRHCGIHRNRCAGTLAAAGQPPLSLQKQRAPPQRSFPIKSSTFTSSRVVTNTTSATVIQPRDHVFAYPLSPRKVVPRHIERPPYADTGRVPIHPHPEHILIFDDAESIALMRNAGRLARKVLDVACAAAHVGVTTDEIDTLVHEAILQHDAYPSPLNYQGFPKSLCSSINEVICHGIPDKRPLQLGDVVSFDVSCFLNGVHGDNCATVIVGDVQDDDAALTANVVEKDWRGVPIKTTFDSEQQERHFLLARRLVNATLDSLYAGIDACKPGGCLSHVGAAIHDVADSYGFSTVEKYRGHGISHEFHCAPFVKVGEMAFRGGV